MVKIGQSDVFDLVKNMMMKSAILAAAFAVASTAAQAITLVSFEGVNGATVNGTDEAPGVTQFNLGRSIGLTQNAGLTFNSRDWEEGVDKLTALANNNAIFWGLVIDASSPYDLTTLEIDYDRSNTGPTSMAIDLFIDNVFQAEVFSNNAVANSASQTATVDLSAFSNVTGAVFFRLSAWGASSALGTFDIENDLAGGRGIIISGEVAAVPLPAGLPLLAGSLALLAGLRRRQKS